MDSDEYFNEINASFNKAYEVAVKARSLGYDPRTSVEIRPAPDLASRVEGIIGIDGLSDIIKAHADGKSRQELAFDMVRVICTDNKFDMEISARLTLAVRIGLAILTEGILVAPTEGVQGVELHKNPDGTSYISVMYAGPIRGAGGTSAALSVALADFARKLLGIGSYKAQKTEVERCIEEIQIYNSRAARLQYLPGDEDIRTILSNCPVCIDGMPTEQLEVAIHRNVVRLDANGKPQLITNRIRGGICLVSCEGIAQKAKSVLKYTKMAELDWSWLNKIIKVEKGTSKPGEDKKKTAVFLQELVAGRPVFAYPNHRGSFRLRYGRSRLTGIAAKGFSPATMAILDDFIAVGTQLKVEKPGKGCIAMPVDSIEGPFVKLDSGQALRINAYEDALRLRSSVKKILSVGDILVTYGDFKKTNTPLEPSSYVEEFWYEELKAAGFNGPMPSPASFKEALGYSNDYGVPMHPKYIYEYAEIQPSELRALAESISEADTEKSEDSIFGLKSITLSGNRIEEAREALERLCVPHMDYGDRIKIDADDAQSLAFSLGFTENGKLHLGNEVLGKYIEAQDSLQMLSAISPVKIMRRSTRIGGRMGRPEKARSRLMKPAPNVLFPVGELGGKERSVSKAYSIESKKFDSKGIYAEVARFRCDKGGEYLNSFYCRKHKSRATIERKCSVCGHLTKDKKCEKCGSKTNSSENKVLDLIEIVNAALSNLGIQAMPKNVKGVKSLMNGDMVPEPIEKGILRSLHDIHIFKDGTVRFDATDAPITHFYPSEISTPVERLKELGYKKDYLGNELKDGSQLVELMHQDVILNINCAEYFLKVSNFIDDLLVKYYGMQPFYKASKIQDLLGHYVITLSPHTSAGVLCRIIGFTKSNVGFAHPYVISARRRNCDGDEDTTMMLLDGLINFSRSYLPTTIGGTMDAPLILTINVMPEEVDDEVHAMEVSESYGLAFYKSTLSYANPSEVEVEIVANRLGKKSIFSNLKFTTPSSDKSINSAPIQSSYTKLKTMQDKINKQFELMDILYSIDRSDTARRLILSHFIPDLMGNLHSFSKQTFRCGNCNAKYRRVPLIGKCTKCGGKLLLTISKGGIEKYLETATDLANRYNLENYIKQRILLLRDEINAVFGIAGTQEQTKQFNLTKFM
ncbi:MAG: DNA polymerase II large subunit [Candidatus Marsarchaeota archaeon]|jgi:DNA polymerase II large subunit|nr:DNA polymerase II large subunit [Candidatus Marsarchaeota archaeon]